MTDLYNGYFPDATTKELMELLICSTKWFGDPAVEGMWRIIKSTSKLNFIDQESMQTVTNAIVSFFRGSFESAEKLPGNLSLALLELQNRFRLGSTDQDAWLTINREPAISKVDPSDSKFNPEETQITSLRELATGLRTLKAISA